MEMGTNPGIAALEDFLEKQPPGPIKANDVAHLVADAWDELDVSDDTSMQANKLWRMEEVEWKSPFLCFDIERHGATVKGSSRATVYTWSIDIGDGTASIVRQRRRQLYDMDTRIDIKSIAKSLLEAFEGKEDERLKWKKDGSVQLNIAVIIPETNKQTTSARRRRLRRALDKLLSPHGWKAERANTYALRHNTADDNVTDTVAHHSRNI
jgi:hypothetical protein